MDSAEVTRLVTYAERARTDDWTLRSALVRYGQVAPERASIVLELIRRTDGALAHLEAHPERASADDEPVLEVARILDEIGDILAVWAIERGTPRHDDIETHARHAASRLSALGIEREDRDARRPRRRG